MFARLSEPLTALSNKGEVLIDGPGIVIATLSPDAAEETGQRLIEAAKHARKDRDASLATAKPLN